ncbi:MAG TPA: oxygenase MpaB family protein [Solirubrobacteraceae bacterium]|nr:oxygenase MpaB family protein [Solirubrobacteraceae bacterium]
MPSRVPPAAAAGASYFGPGSVIRRVQGERAVALSGPRALLMQASHPLAVAGLLAHSSALDEPYDRLARTAEVMSLITFGPRDQADRVTGHVRAMHRAVRGRLPRAVGPFAAGTPYRADDPRLLMWILYTLIDSAVLVYRTYVGRLSERDRDALWHDYRIVGALFGLRDADMPETLRGLDEYGAAMLAGGELVVGEWARRRAREIVLEPPVPQLARPLLETVNFITVALLPEVIRRQYGFAPLPPAAVRSALVAAGALYVRRGVIPFLPAQIRRVPAARRAGTGRRGAPITVPAAAARAA